MQTIYIDELFILNVYINYLLLAATGRICTIRPRLYRILLGAFLGGFYAILMFFPSMGFLENIVVKVILAGSMVAVVFGSTSLRMFAKLCASFLGLSFALAGLLLLVWIFAAPAGMRFSNGVAYFEISPLLLIASTAGCYLVIWIFSWIGPRRVPDSRQYRLVIQMQGKTVRIPAIMDSGNELTESRSGLPVIVVSLEKVSALMPTDVLACFETFDQTVTLHMSDSFWKSRFAVVPYHTVRGHGLFPAFRPERAELICNSQSFLLGQVIIAVSKEPVSNEYGAILSPRISIDPKKQLGGKRYADKMDQ